MSTLTAPVPATVSPSGQAAGPAAARPKARWAGYVLTALPSLFLLFDGGIKFTGLPPVNEANARLGFPLGIVPAIGALELACLALYLFPRTAVLGAVLLTGFLGGATAIHVRVGDPFVFPLVVGLLVWLGVYLRDARLRALFPLRTASA